MLIDIHNKSIISWSKSDKNFSSTIISRLEGEVRVGGAIDNFFMDNWIIVANSASYVSMFLFYPPIDTINNIRSALMPNLGDA